MTDYQRFLSRAGASLRTSPIRQMGAMLGRNTDLISFAPGYPADDLFPVAAFAAIAADVLGTSDRSLLQYAATRGYRPFREAIADLMRTRGVTVPGDDIVVTTGSQQGLDLVARVLVDRGDAVLMELPTYTGAITAFGNAGARLVGVRQDAGGLDFDHLDDTWKRVTGDGIAVKYLYVVPNFQNPSGVLMNQARRFQLLEWAAQRDVLIVEDDPYGELYFDDVTPEDVRPVAASDVDRRVLYLSSFSKTLAPGLRVGWLHAAPALAAKIELAKQSTDLSTGGLDQRIAFEACRRGVLAGHLPPLRAAYQQKRDAMVAALQRTMADRVAWAPAHGGFFLWARLDVSAEALLDRAKEEGVLFVVGRAFFVDGDGDRFVRLSFSAPSTARIDEGITRLSRALISLAPAPAPAAARTSPASGLRQA